MARQVLTAQEFIDAGKALSCEPAAIKAAYVVESGGSGFLPDGRPKILFEAHVFSRLTERRFDDSHPALSSPKWNRELYKGGAAEHDRLAAAMKLDATAALQSASWGGFQIMGFNYAMAGFDSVGAFATAMTTGGESAHLRAFVEYVRHAGLADELRRHDWAGFAHGYNGPGYAANKYDAKIAGAYAEARRERWPA